jgi:hypothetical protein
VKVYKAEAGEYVLANEDDLRKAGRFHVVDDFALITLWHESGRYIYHKTPIGIRAEVLGDE